MLDQNTPLTALISMICACKSPRELEVAANMIKLDFSPRYNNSAYRIKEWARSEIKAKTWGTQKNELNPLIDEAATALDRKIREFNEQEAKLKKPEDAWETQR